MITCMTNKRNKMFRTPVGVFSYKYLENSKFRLGIRWNYDETGSYFMASMEKAICDRVAIIKSLKVDEMEEFLEQNFDLLPYLKKV